MRISIVSKLYAIAGAVLFGTIAVGLWWQRNQFPNWWDLLDDDTRLFLLRVKSIEARPCLQT